ncbi:aspartate-semialdehyde dehydrogenase [Sulfolobales archaeon HS-7]|nr:aspartate-semialdehyde dehydrogenase [Sulfolobales archaeon HS-7]
MDKIRVSILGSTGIVGQIMIKLLNNHPLIEVVRVSASHSKIGLRYTDAVRWIAGGKIPEYAANMRLVSTDPEEHEDVDLVLSALPNEIAEDVEVKLVRRGATVISNASPLRIESDIPLINPEVNWKHLDAVKIQKETRRWKGILVKNPNCTSAIVSLVLKPLTSLGLKEIYLTTLQSVSGAGYKGLPFMAIDGNIIPYIKGEEEKIVVETNKMLGTSSNTGIVPNNLKVFPTSIRVPTKIGHMAIINLVLNDEYDSKEIKEKLTNFKALPQEKNLPTAPETPIEVTELEDRPQPSLDLEEGMKVKVGRITVNKNTVRLIALGDNLVRGAAGITILTLEVMRELGYV